MELDLGPHFVELDGDAFYQVDEGDDDVQESTNCILAENGQQLFGLLFVVLLLAFLEYELFDELFVAVFPQQGHLFVEFDNGGVVDEQVRKLLVREDGLLVVDVLEGEFLEVHKRLGFVWSVGYSIIVIEESGDRFDEI